MRCNVCGIACEMDTAVEMVALCLPCALNLEALAAALHAFAVGLDDEEDTL